MLHPSISPARLKKFQRDVWSFYREQGRTLPWRDNLEPYAIVVSEVMLQQTQVKRVTPKFNDFLELFPNFSSLAKATLADVITVWQGLGYNRRGLFLHNLAKRVVENYNGVLPDEVRALESLPGIGPATARSIAAFAFNAPVVFIETNIRRVFLHHFFAGQVKVSDRELLPLIEATLPIDNAREWYWALMDYGTHLAGQVENPNRRSRHYSKQSRFEGSRRQIRGAVVRLLISSSQTKRQLLIQTKCPEAELTSVLTDMEREGLIEEKVRCWQLKS